MIDWLCATLGINKSAFLSGLLGGLFSLRWVPQVGWVGILSAIVFAGVVANYVTRPVYQWLAIQSLHEGGVGFLVGLFAMSMAGACFKALGELQLGPMLADAARRLLGGKA
jgi:hypothetical protein